MAAEDIPSECDLIVVGTGLVESIVAAAASRIGKQVVHLDHRDFYGSNWASFSFSNWENTLGLPQESPDVLTDKPGEGSNISINIKSNSIHNVVEMWHISDETAPTNNEETQVITSPAAQQTWTKSDILKNSRKFNLDLSPKVLYSRGEMVEVLISSGICRYAEFKNVSGIFAYNSSEHQLLSVPCSRADVFNSKEINMVEKRLLMKILSLCVDYENKSDNFKEFESNSFGDFLTAHKIQGKIRQYIIESVAMGKESTNFRDAMKSIQKFVQSIGRYGNTPFLWTLYGSGELPQCFCRCSAVFGGVYCLKRPIQSIEVGSDGQATGVVSENQTIKSKYILIEDCLNPFATVKSGVSRAILLTDRSLTGGDQATLISVPSVSGRESVRVLELSASTMACPRGLFVVHLITRQVSTAVEDLQEVIQTLFNGETKEDSPNILWSLYFNIKEYDNNWGDKTQSNLYFGVGPNSSVDIDYHVIQAKSIFQSMFPDDDFLPRVPDPEDIILEGSSESPEIIEELEHQ